MAYTGTIVTEPEIALMAGENVDATGDTEANHNLGAAFAESWLSNLLRYNVVDNYAGLNTDVKKSLAEWAARMIGNDMITNNMAGYTTREEAEDMINVNLDRMKKLEELMIKQFTVTFIKGA